MFKMTSSSNIAPATPLPKSAHKPLTDFSIEAIIGKQALQETPKQEDNQKVLISPQQAAINYRANYGISETKMLRSPHEGDQHRLDPASANTQRKYRPKNFQCPACKMAFSNNGQLKNHVRIHTGERPFACNQLGCNKTFTRNEELTRHKRIHTGQRPYGCMLCNKCFGRKDHLKKHTRTHEKHLAQTVKQLSPVCVQTIFNFVNRNSY